MTDSKDLVRCRITVSAPVYPTEEPEKVREAIMNLVYAGTLELVKGTDHDTLVSGSLGPTHLFPLRDLLAREGGRTAVATYLRRAAPLEEATLYFNKQAAHAGRAALCSDPRESPMGPVTISIHGNLGELIAYLGLGSAKPHGYSKTVPRSQRKRKAVEDLL